MVQEAWDRAELPLARSLLERHIPEQAGDADFRGFEWYYFWKLTHGAESLLEGSARDVRALAMSPDGKYLAVGKMSGTVILWNTDQADKKVEISLGKDPI